MTGRTLSVYFGARFVRAILGIFLLVLVLVFLFDLLELVRRAVDRDTFSWGLVVAISAARVPALAEQVWPFATLFGAMLAFLSLTRRLELVVTRAAGVSVWQFAAPGIAVAVVLGVLTTTVYNPIAAWLLDRSEDAAIELFGKQQRTASQRSEAVWVRQDGPAGESVLRAGQALDQGARLVDVTALVFGKDGRFSARITADEARLEPGRWILFNAVTRTASADPVHQDRAELPTYLSPEQVAETLSAPDSVPFWRLPTFIELADRAGLPAFRYRLQYQTLLARPLLLAAMVMIAATVSLRVFRFGNIGRMVLYGVSAGFVLYVVTELAKSLGSVGLVSPVVAAWAPALVTTLMGVSILLHQEDG